VLDAIGQERPRLIATTIAGLLLAIATPPAGDPAPPALRWRAPPGCPTHDDVAASLAAQAVATTDAQPSPLATDATVRETAAGTWAVTITVTSATDEIHRELELDSCAAAAEAVALIYGLALTGDLDPAGDPDPATNDPAVPYDNGSGATVTLAFDAAILGDYSTDAFNAHFAGIEGRVVLFDTSVPSIALVGGEHTALTPFVYADGRLQFTIALTLTADNAFTHTHYPSEDCVFEDEAGTCACYYEDLGEYEVAVDLAIAGP
jgi:hypothetical protein